MADFNQTYRFVQDAPIDKLHIFRYSPRPKTAAFYMAKHFLQLSISIKKKRAAALTKLSNDKYQLFLHKHLELTFTALFLKHKHNGYQQVLLNNQVLVYIKTHKNLAGKIKTVRINQFKHNQLLGKII